MARRPLTVPTSGTEANALDFGDNPTALAVWVTPDGTVVGGPGAWRQLSSLLPQAYAANWAVTDWYIDGVTGNDANNGTTALTPLRTGAELTRRLGAYALWGQSVTVHVGANGMTDALVLRGAMLVAGTHLDAVGTTTVLANDTVAAFAAVDHTIPRGSQVTATVLADWTPYLNRRCRLTSGLKVGGIWWVGFVSPGGAGLNVARVSPPCWIDQASATETVAAVVPAPGDTFAIESLPSVPEITIDIDGPILTAAGALWAKRQWNIRDLNVTYASVRGPGFRIYRCASMFGCRVGNTDSSMVVSAGSIYFRWAGCSFFLVDSVANTQFQAYGRWDYCYAGDGIGGVFGAQIWSASNCLFERCQTGSSYSSFLIGVQIFDCPSGSAASFQLGSLSNVSGDNNVSFGLNLTNFTLLRLQSVINIKGTVSDARLGVAPAIQLTTAQAIQPDDYAQKGTAQLGAGGTVTVNVTWWDPTTQRLTLTRNTPGGAIGDLSAPQATRTNTQFVVNSANAGDTSTFDWQISPLGRNIFVGPI